MHYRLLFLLLIQCILIQGLHAKQSTVSHHPPVPSADLMAKWVFLGSKTVDFGLDRDIIEVDTEMVLSKNQNRSARRRPQYASLHRAL